MNKQLAAVVAAAKFLPEPNYGPGVEVARPGLTILSDALDWECGSCRVDVGWPKWEYIERTAAGEISFYVQCGHCLHAVYYDADGNQISD